MWIVVDSWLQRFHAFARSDSARLILRLEAHRVHHELDVAVRVVEMQQTPSLQAIAVSFDLTAMEAARAGASWLNPKLHLNRDSM